MTGLVALKMWLPLLAKKVNDWVPTPHTEGRNAVEHSERSEELCQLVIFHSIPSPLTNALEYCGIPSHDKRIHCTRL
jgi:hypothetical protein